MNGFNLHFLFGSVFVTLMSLITTIKRNKHKTHFPIISSPWFAHHVSHYSFFLNHLQL